MRIAIVSPNFPMKTDPQRAVYVYHAVRHLQRHAELQVFCPLVRYPSFLRPADRPVAAQQGDFSPEGVRTTYFDYPALPVVSRPLNAAVCAARLEPLLRRFQPDLVLAYWIYPEGRAAVLAGHRMGVPVVVRSIGSDINRIPDAYSRRMVTRTLREAEFVLTASAQLRERALALGADPARTQAVLNGCDTAVFAPRDRSAARVELGLKQQEKLVLFVGRLEPEKGLVELLEAVARLQGTMPVRLVLLGVNRMGADLDRRIAGLGLQGQVEVRGTFPPPVVAQWMAAADVVALASHAEGCPNVVLEALACGRPVVATPVGCVPDIVNQECGRLVPVGDVAALAQGLLEVLGREWNDREISRRFARGWDQAAQEIAAICSAVLGAAANPCKRGAATSE